MIDPEFNADAVRERMRNMSVTVEDVAEATGKTRSAAYKWFAERKNERNTPKFEDAAIIAQLIKWPLGALAGIEEPRSMRYKPC